MNLHEYKCRLYEFGNVFKLIFNIKDDYENQYMNVYDTNNTDFVNKKISEIRFIIEKGLGTHILDIKQNAIMLDDKYIKSITSLNKVNLLADIDTLTEQAEAVKNEIIEMGKKHSNNIQKLFYQHDSSLLINDFIRDSDNNIVEPFTYWRDCVEIYIRKHINKMSNNNIARTYPIMSSTCATDRSKLHFISTALDECKRLEFILRQKKYPPSILSGTKQPSLKGHIKSTT